MPLSLILKRGGLSISNNWRVIVLLDMVRKLVARVLQEQLQEWTENVVLMLYNSIPQFLCVLS